MIKVRKSFTCACTNNCVFRGGQQISEFKILICVYVSVCVCVRERVCECLSACVRVRPRACMIVCVSV